MAYSRHPYYRAVRQKSKWLAFLYAVADLSYYIGLISGLIGGLSVLLAWPFDRIRGNSRHPWTSYAGHFLIVLGIAVVLVGIAAGIARHIRVRMGLR